MKTYVRYLIVAAVMCLFLGIVAYLFLDTPTVVSGPCGSGKCNEATVPAAPPPQVELVTPPSITNESISVQPVIMEDEEEVPDIVAEDDPIIKQVMETLNINIPSMTDGAIPGKTVESVIDGVVSMTETEFMKMVGKNMNALDPVPTNDEDEPAIVELRSDSSDVDEATVVPESVSAPTPDTEPVVPVQEPVKKRRGRPPVKGIHGKRSQQVVDALGGAKKDLNHIDEE